MSLDLYIQSLKVYLLLPATNNILKTIKARQIVVAFIIILLYNQSLSDNIYDNITPFIVDLLTVHYQ